MIVLTDPIIITITLIVIIFALIGGAIAAASKKQNNNSNMNVYQPTPTTSFCIETEFKFSGHPMNVNTYSSVSLVRDHENPFADYLIAVKYKDQQIGYLKPDVSKQLAPLIDSGTFLQARIINVILDSQNNPERCIIQIKSI